MSCVQVALNVDDLDEASTFYSKLFNIEPAKVKPGCANFAITESPLKLVLLENPGHGGTLNHLASGDTVHTEIARLGDEGLFTEEELMDGVDGVCVVTPDFTDEVTAIGNLIHAAEEASSVRHIVGLIGDPPGVTMGDVPANLPLLGEGTGAAVGHQAARELLDRGSTPGCGSTRSTTVEQSHVLRSIYTQRKRWSPAWPRRPVLSSMACSRPRW
ncbi:MAG: VOC family protein [Mycobacterium sp.]|nr:VOC family protein [Mycobacterium sp.]